MSGVDSLRAIFPDLEADILAQILSAHGGDVERAIESLLESDPASGPGNEGGPNVNVAEASDEALARQLQEEMDRDVAQTVQQEIQAELTAEERAKRAASLEGKTVAAVEKAAVGAKKALFRGLGAMGVTKPMLSARSQKTHGTRLLDADSAADEAYAGMDPISSPLYTPPALLTASAQAPAAPPPTQYAAAAPSATPPVDLSDPSMTTAPLVMQTGSMSAAADPGATADRYSSRVARARAANRTSQRLSTGDADQARPESPPVTMGDVEPQVRSTQQQVPVANLIDV